MVLILHPTEELKLVKFQKKIIEDLNDSNTIYIASFPIWATFPVLEPEPATKEDLKLFSKTINNISVLEIISNSKEINIKLEFQTGNKTFNVLLPVLKLYKGKAKELPETLELPFKKIKIFRLGIPEDLSSNSKAISESVWCKL